MDSIVTSLGAVPAVFWSAIFGSVLTLGGVLIIDRGNSKRQKQQLENVAEEAKRARAAGLRKEVYLKTAVELTKGMENLGKLPFVDMTTPNFSNGFSNFYKAAAQFQLVAELNTSLMMVRFVGEINAIHLKTMVRVAPITEEQVKADGFDQLRISANNASLEIVEEQKRLERAGLSSSKEFLILSENLLFWQKNSDENFQQQMYHHATKNKLTLEAGQALINDLATVGSSQLDLLIQMRMELGFESDVTQYRKVMKEARSKIDEQTREIFSKMAEKNTRDNSIPSPK